MNAIELCYECQGVGHIRFECPKLKGNTRSQGSGSQAKKETAKVVSGTFLLNSKPAFVLFNSGADYSFVSTTFCKSLKLPTSTLSEALARKYLAKRYSTFLAYVVNVKVEKSKIEEVRIANEFPDVFPDDLPGLPPERQVEFRIDVLPGAAPIARAPYRLAPAEM
ncbi:hypothetical protein OSB04_012658 [Centaurea solstitialis]|uniref:CCHC-type domain-containing protein n=1 Tax=Centaurea solstitialis TaxID=347529 RepID=A0AA38TBS3_9ASTR|nr:hypothetical protein OSB04_012658 [Centaurea solstitialis]